MQSYEWEWYEKRITELFKRVKGATIQHNVKELGKISKELRQIDILIFAPLDIIIDKRMGFRIPIEIKIIVDCKNRSRPIDLSEIGQIITLKSDVEAHMAIVVSPKGITDGAKKQAQNQGVLPIVVTHDLIAAAGKWDKEDWYECRICEWDCEDGIPNYIDWRNENVGYCGRCNSLNVRCPECHEVFGILEGEYETPLQCGYECGSAFYVELTIVDHERVQEVHIFDMLECRLLSEAYNKSNHRLTQKEYEKIVSETRWQYWEVDRPEIVLTEECLMEWGEQDCLYITTEGIKVYESMIKDPEYPVCG